VVAYVFDDKSVLTSVIFSLAIFKVELISHRGVREVLLRSVFLYNGIRCIDYALGKLSYNAYLDGRIRKMEFSGFCPLR